MSDSNASHETVSRSLCARRRMMPIKRRARATARRTPSTPQGGRRLEREPPGPHRVAAHRAGALARADRVHRLRALRLRPAPAVDARRVLVVVFDRGSAQYRERDRLPGRRHRRLHLCQPHRQLPALRRRPRDDRDRLRFGLRVAHGLALPGRHVRRRRVHLRRRPGGKPVATPSADAATSPT